MSALFGNVEVVLVTDPWYLAKEFLDVAAAVVNTAIETYVAEQYIDLSKKYRRLYQHSWDFYNNNFQIFGEATLVDQVFNHPLAGNGQANALFYVPQYAQQWNNVNVFRAQGAFSRFWWQNHANMYADAPLNFGCDPRGNPIAVGEPEQLDIYATVDDSDSYLYRYEEHLKDVYDERTWEWQNEALNYGVKQANIVQTGYATSFEYMDHASTNLSDWFGQQADGFMAHHNYLVAQKEAAEKLRQAALEGRRAGTTYPEVSNFDVIKRNLTPAPTPPKEIWESWEQP